MNHIHRHGPGFAVGVVLTAAVLLFAGFRVEQKIRHTGFVEQISISDNAKATHMLRRGGVDLQHPHNWRMVFRVDKYLAPPGVKGNWKPSRQQIASGAVKPWETLFGEGNLITTAGAGRTLNRLIGTGSTTALDTADTRVCVGDGTTAVAITDTDLSAAAGSTHRFYSLVDQAPSVSTNVATWHATVGTADGNFHWQEWCLDNGTASGSGTINALILNHKLTDFGTKTSSASWGITVTLTLT